MEVHKNIHIYIYIHIYTHICSVGPLSSGGLVRNVGNVNINICICSIGIIFPYFPRRVIKLLRQRCLESLGTQVYRHVGLNTLRNHKSCYKEHTGHVLRTSPRSSKPKGRI